MILIKKNTVDSCLFLFFFSQIQQTARVHSCNCNASATGAAAEPLKLRMRAKLIGYKSCGAVWQQSASLTRCRGRTGAPRTQVIGLTCFCGQTTSAVCLGVRGSVFATPRADAAVTVGWRRRCRRRRVEMKMRRRGEEELPSAPNREFGHREGKVGGEGRRGGKIPDARPRAEAELCVAVAQVRTLEPRPVQPTRPHPQNSCMCGKSASFQLVKLLLSSQSRSFRATARIFTPHRGFP